MIFRLLCGKYIKTAVLCISKQPIKQFQKNHMHFDFSHNLKSNMQLYANDFIKKTAEYVDRSLAGNDASHDYAHIQRVHALAENIAKQENCSPDEVELVSLAALLHDIADWKYSGSETAGVEAARAFLKSLSYPNDRIERVCWIIQRVSFHDEIGRTKNEIEEMKKDKLLCIVQDADRCDAIGAIGIARCFTFGGKKGRKLYEDHEVENIVREISKEEYMASEKKSATIDHFYEKLLLLKEKMKTEGGRKVAEGRHEFMKVFLQQFSAEVKGTQ